MMDAEKNAAALCGCIAVIPALDPDEALPEYAAALLERGAEQIVVVDDGSGEACQGIFRILEKMEGCTVLRHGQNRGKGRAMKDAFAYIAGQERFAGCAVVTADADGQHCADDVCAVAQAARKERDKLVLGVRDLTLPQVPKRSRLGNRLSSWGFHALYGVKLEDTQTGLRGIPWELLNWCCSIKGERYEYEMNALVHCAREKVELRQVPIQTIYYDNNQNSHLRALRDTWRVFVVLISGLGWYTASSALSAVTDVAAFWMCSAVVFRFLPALMCYWWSTLAARALSSALNYTLNRRYVFGGSPSRRTLARYYCLWGCQLLCSYLLLLALNWLLPGIWPTVNKALGDIILALCSYQIQMHWVFRSEESHETR
ncbi:MAG: bifunctional glycosyltransferase family 2/GtrA family protein [Oscillospiraceae bacterium]|nr:bifunctional glycosyltransferase family 2/GtrA family protein [Oscillospiraceae bacterium]